MNAIEKCNLFLLGGTLGFPSTTRPQRIFKKGWLRSLILALIMLSILPSLGVHSKGFIEYKYPPGFLSKSTVDQYFVILRYHIALVLKRISSIDVKYTDKIPEAKDPFWKFIIFLTFLIGDVIISFLLITISIISYKNIKELIYYCSRLQRLNLQEDITYGSFLPNMSRR